VGCRARKGAGTLVRVVLGPAGQLVIDRKGQGRGAWLCRLGETELAEPDCISRAGRRGAFTRALRADVRAGEVELMFATASERARMGLRDAVATKGGGQRDAGQKDAERD
jgi:predicted RNA-binding protein YlxR (DUF448 family)